MNIIVPTDVSRQLAASVSSQKLTLEEAWHLEGIFTAYSSVEHRPLPDTTPTAANVASAVQTLKGDFLGRFGPYWRQEGGDGPQVTSLGSFANALAMVIQPLARTFISGETPLFWVKDDGALDFVEGVSSLYFPGPVVRVPWIGKDRGFEQDRNFESEINAGLQWSPIIFWIEGKNRKHSSKALERALAFAQRWAKLPSGVILTSLPNRCVWVVTNVESLSERLSTQSIVVNVKQNRDHTDCRWQSISSFIAYNRPRFYGAALTLVLAWIEAGKPLFHKKHRPHSNWSEVIGGILQVARVSGFLDD